MSLALVALFGLLAFANAGLPYDFDPRIVNGEDVKFGQIPYQVSMQLKGSNFHFCGGSILNKNYIITAAHCAAGQYAQNLQVVAGTILLNNRTHVHNVSRIIIHEKYNPGDSWKNDIALLQVKPPLEKQNGIGYVEIQSANETVKPQTPAIVSGWGRLWQGGPSPNKLQLAHLVIANQQQCAKTYAGVFQTIHESHICANDPQIETGACNGDSGGPLTVKGKLVGIVSWSMGCALRQYPTVYTRVTSFLDWIKTHAI